MRNTKEIVYERLIKLQHLLHRQQMQKFGGMRGSKNPRRGQGRVLSILKMKPEISQKELTYLLDMSKQALAELLAKLERNGYIIREPSAEDRRVSNVKITPEGMKAAEGMSEDPQDMVGLLDCLNEEELEAFGEYLARILACFEERFMNKEAFAERRMAFEAFSHEQPHRRGRGGFPSDGRPLGYGINHEEEEGGED